MRRSATSTTPLAVPTVTAWLLLASFLFQKVSACLGMFRVNYNDMQLLIQRRKNTTTVLSFASSDASFSTRPYLVSWTP